MLVRIFLQLVGLELLVSANKLFQAVRTHSLMSAWLKQQWKKFVAGVTTFYL
jgi:hypothetical protein